MYRGNTGASCTQMICGRFRKSTAIVRKQFAKYDIDSRNRWLDFVGMNTSSKSKNRRMESGRRMYRVHAMNTERGPVVLGRSNLLPT